MCGWPWKFYQQQVAEILKLLEQKITGNSQFKSEDEYYAVMEKLGREPNPDKLPLNDADFPYEVQMAFFVHSLLPDVWDGAGGNYFGKNWSSLAFLVDLYKIENPKEVVLFLKYIDAYTMTKRNDDMEKKRKKADNKSGVGNIPPHPDKMRP